MAAVQRHSLVKPDLNIARGSGRNPILRFIPTAEILLSSQIAITTYIDTQ